MKRRRIPQLQPEGLGCRRVDVYERARRTGRKSDAERLAAEPWRADGYGAAYRRARQAVMERQGGRCAVTGKQVAAKVGGVWRITEPGAGVHHKTSLSEGGAGDPSNLVLLSASAHAMEDARRRREGGS